MNYKLVHDFRWDAVSRVETPTMCPLVYYWKRKKWRWCSAPVKGSIKNGGKKNSPQRRQRSLLIPSAEYVCLLICVCYPCLCNISRAAPSTRRTASSSDREYFLCEGDIALRWSHRTEGQILDLNNTDGTVEPLSGSRLSQALSAAPDLNRSAASGGWKMRREGRGFDRRTPLSTAVTFDVWPKSTWQRSPDVDVFLHLCVYCHICRIPINYFPCLIKSMSDESGKLIDSSSFLHIDHQKKNSQNRMLMVPVIPEWDHSRHLSTS